jgi:uncharacterized membrane protein YfcA
MELVIIAIAAAATAVLSALAGLGGGIILLAVLAQFFAPVVAIPIHGGIQLVANGSRAYLLRGEIAWKAVLWSSLLLFPASLLGVLVATSVPEDATRAALGIFALVITWRPSLLMWRGNNQMPEQTLIGVGAASGFINTTVGASGPVTSPFFRAVTASHAAFVATAAASQVIAHISKVGAFLIDGFPIEDHLLTIGVGAAAVTVGSWIGTRLLGRVEERYLGWIFRAVLTALAVRLIVTALL